MDAAADGFSRSSQSPLGKLDSGERGVGVGRGPKVGGGGTTTASEDGVGVGVGRSVNVGDGGNDTDGTVGVDVGQGVKVGAMVVAVGAIA